MCPDAPQASEQCCADLSVAPQCCAYLPAAANRAVVLQETDGRAHAGHLTQLLRLHPSPLWRLPEHAAGRLPAVVVSRMGRPHGGELRGPQPRSSRLRLRAPRCRAPHPQAPRRPGRSRARSAPRRRSASLAPPWRPAACARQQLRSPGATGLHTACRPQVRRSTWRPPHPLPQERAQRRPRRPTRRRRDGRDTPLGELQFGLEQRWP